MMFLSPRRGLCSLSARHFSGSVNVAGRPMPPPARMIKSWLLSRTRSFTGKQSDIIRTTVPLSLFMWSSSALLHAVLMSLAGTAVPL